MALFAPRSAGIEVVPIEGHEDLGLVSTDDAEQLLDALAMETSEYVERQELAPEVSRALGWGLFGVTGVERPAEATTVGARSVARFGYMARVVERERIPAARKARGWMLAGLRQAVEASVREELGESSADDSFYDALAEVTAFFVRREPLDVPFDAEEGFRPMWTIPGMGGDFRALLRDRTLTMALPRNGDQLVGPASPVAGMTFDDLRYVWKYGFLLRAFEEFFRHE
jgi:hypothetical protein